MLDVFRQHFLTYARLIKKQWMFLLDYLFLFTSQYFLYFVFVNKSFISEHFRLRRAIFKLFLFVSNVVSWYRIGFNTTTLSHRGNVLLHFTSSHLWKYELQKCTCFNRPNTSFLGFSKNPPSYGINSRTDWAATGLGEWQFWI